MTLKPPLVQWFIKLKDPVYTISSPVHLTGALEVEDDREHDGGVHIPLPLLLRGDAGDRPSREDLRQ